MVQIFFFRKQIFLGTQHFLRPTSFWHKVFGTPNMFGPEIVCTQIKCWTNNFICIKYLGPNFVWTKLFGLKTNLDQQFHPDQIFGTKLFSDPSFLRSNIWFDRTNFCTRLGYFDLKCCLENKIKTWVWLSSAQLVYYFFIFNFFLFQFPTIFLPYFFNFLLSGFSYIFGKVFFVLGFFIT